MDIELNQQRIWSLKREAARQSLFYADRGNADLALFWKSIADGLPNPEDTNISKGRIPLSLLSPVNKSNNSSKQLEDK